MNGSPKKILIIKLSALGDVVHTFPAVQSLRESHAFIAWMVEQPYKELLEANPDVDEVIPVRIKHWRKNWNAKSFREISAVLTKIKQHRFDTVIDFNGLLKSGIIARLSGAKTRVGFHRKDCRESLNALFSNRRAPRMEPGKHIVNINLALAQTAGGSGKSAGPVTLEIPKEQQTVIDEYMTAQPALTARPIAAINPGAGFASKLWELDRFAALADRMVKELGFSILLTWGPGEREQAERIAKAMTAPAFIAPASTILQSVALYRRLALFVGCDSGPVHLAAALGIPTVSIFGPTDPARNGAFGAGQESVFKVLSCSFCWKRTCPLGTGECMQQVEVEEVFQTVRKIAANYANIKPVKITES
jgi:lipopolysaccharide heptosyltransferase I